jgi:hypothetical protein
VVTVGAAEAAAVGISVVGTLGVVVVVHRRTHHHGSNRTK